MSVSCFLPFVGLGSCLLHMTYIHEFAKKEGPVTILTFSKSLSDALKFDPNVKKVIVIENYNRKFSEIFKLSKNLKNLNIKKIFIFKCSLRFYLAAKFAGIFVKSYPFYKKMNLHLVEEARRFTMKNLNLKNCPTETRLYINKSILSEVKNNFNSNRKNILIAPSSSGPTTMWKISHFTELMKKLNENFDCFFIIALDSSEKEKKISSEIANVFDKKKIIFLCDKTISQLMPIISLCNLSICNDTSFQHISCQLNVPTIILRFDTPAAYSSYSKLQYSILPKGYAEVNHDTRADTSLITVDMVLEKSLALLN